MHNNIGYGSRVKTASIGEMTIEVLDPTASCMYLGRDLSLTNPHETELNHRLRKAWGKFGAFKSELTDKAIPLRLRLKLFQSVVAPTVLYGCCSWVMTRERTMKLKSTQSKMLRTMLGRRRLVDTAGELETWVDWIQRVTHEARQLAGEQGIPCWVEEHIAKVEKWKQQLAGMEHRRWAKQVVDWQPQGCRSRGRPRARWLSPSGT